MSEREPGRDGSRHQSDVLGAIFDAVEDKPGTTTATSTPFRAKALEQIDVPQQIDNLLPLTSRRTWLILVAVALAVVAGAVYAVGTVRVQSIHAEGRSMAPPGLVSVTAPRAMVVTEISAAQGSSVTAGQSVASGTDETGAVITVQSPAAGVVWQQLAATGSSVAAGQSVLTVVPSDTSGKVLFAVPEPDAGRVSPGQDVEMTDTRGQQFSGTVTDIAPAPVPPAIAQGSIGVVVEGTEPVVLVVVQAEPAPSVGAAVSGEIILSRRTLAQEWLSLR